MKENRISFETARLAKEKKFRWPVKSHYQYSLTEREHPEDGKSGPFGWEKGELSLENGYFINDWEPADFSSKAWLMCAAPTQAHLQKWLREDHGLVVLLDIVENVKGMWRVQIYADYEEYGVFDLYSAAGFASYEDALEDGLKEALNHVKEDNG